MKSSVSNSNLSIATAEKVFGWRDVHTHDGKLIGKKQDKLGRWQPALVPDYVNDPIQASFILPRMRELGRSAQYLKELATLAKAEKLPLGSATSVHRSRAALKALRK